MAAAVDPTRPLVAHTTIVRRCNLSCGYCFEYDAVSDPVPFDVLCERFDRLAALGTVFVTLNGGEPLLHPRLVDLVTAVRERGMVPLLNTNGTLLKRPLVEALGREGLFGLQMSLDNVVPNAVSRKSLQSLRPKLELLAAHATFRVRINTVLGDHNAADALQVATVANALGFDTQCSFVRDAEGRVRPLGPEARAAYAAIRELSGRLPAAFHDDFQLALARGERLSWKCRSGARYFHLCEDGWVHLCQPRAGVGAVPLASFTREHARRWFHTSKACAATCAHAYAHIGSRLDTWRPQSGPHLDVFEETA
jgi:MoaA/NifB/PqqE/SkfB family radical SAM enzyme